MSIQTWIFDWLSPNGIIAGGVLASLVQQYLVRRAAILAADHARSAAAEVKGMSAAITQVAQRTEQLVVQTNGVSRRLQQVAEKAGRAEGREEMRDEQAAEKARE